MNRASVAVDESDVAHMRRALEIAEAAWGQVAPNPLVGAVVVRNGQVIGEGCHASFGNEHAEVVALQQAGDGARGATLYVSLEPCRHHGKTAPCIDAIRRAGVRRVVAALRDPNPEAGGGLEMLRSEGIEVSTGVCREEAIRQNAHFLWRWSGSTPWVTVKLAVSLDGYIAAREGDRTQITGAAAEAFVHRLRAGHDAIMVGGRTVMVDDPLLTVRGEVVPRVPPLRVVLDPRLRVPHEARLFQTPDLAPTLVLCLEDAPANRRRALETVGVEVRSVAVDGEGKRLSLAAALETIGETGANSVLVEGGGRLVAGLRRGDLVQRQLLIIAPRVLGTDGVRAFPDGSDSPRGLWAVGARRALGGDTLVQIENREAMRMLREAA